MTPRPSLRARSLPAPVTVFVRRRSYSSPSLSIEQSPQAPSPSPSKSMGAIRALPVPNTKARVPPPLRGTGTYTWTHTIANPTLARSPCPDHPRDISQKHRETPTPKSALSTYPPAYSDEPGATPLDGARKSPQHLSRRRRQATAGSLQAADIDPLSALRPRRRTGRSL